MAPEKPGKTDERPGLGPAQILRGLSAEIFAMDASGRILFHEPGKGGDAASSEHLLGRTIREWCRARGYPDPVGERRQAAADRCLEAGRATSFEEIWHSPLGGTRHSIQSFAPVLGASGEPDAVVAVSLPVPPRSRRKMAGPGAVEEEASSGEAAALRAALAELERARRSLEEQCRQRTQAARRRQPPDDFLLGLPGLRPACEAIESLSSTSGPVLVTGEAGSGRSAVARAVHRQRGGDPGLLLELDCAEATTEVEAALLRLEPALSGSGGLAGTTPGPRWFTGLALYDVEALPDSGQRLLTEAIQAAEPEPSDSRGVGSGSGRPICLVATTSGNLGTLAADGRFLSGLAEALTKVRIDVAPLRHRSEDLPLLAGYLLERAASRAGRSVAPLSAADVARLSAYLWPGNLPELATVIERAVVTARDGRPNISLPQGSAPTGGAEPGALGVPVYTESEMRRRERDNLAEALLRTGWKIYGPGGAAALLGVPPTTLTSRMKKLGLQKPGENTARSDDG